MKTILASWITRCNDEHLHTLTLFVPVPENLTGTGSAETYRA